MIGTVLGNIFGFILSVLYAILKFIGRILKDILIVTRLIIPAVYAAVMALLVLFGVIKYEGAAVVLLWIGLGLFTVLAIYLFIRSLMPKKKKQKGQDAPPPQAPPREHGPAPEWVTSGEKPKIYKDKDHPGRMIYEYSDRFELYEKRPEGLMHIQTDYKSRN